jgi:hypothetical protein
LNALTAVATEAAYADALTQIPDRWRTFADSGDPADDFMTGHAWRL